MAWLFALSDKYLLGMLAWLALGVLAFWGLLKYRRRLRWSGRKLTFANLLLSAWLLLALLTGVELYFALVFDTTDSFNMSNVSEIWFRRHVKPQERYLEIAGEALTYRDDQTLPRQIPSDRRHICFLGDSFTFGHGVADVSDRFTNRIRAQLESRSPGEYLVSNLAAPGTDLNWTFVLTRELVEQGIRIDTLVYVFCPNDIEVYDPDYLKNVERIGQLQPDCPLLEHTYFFNLLYYRIRMASLPEAQAYYGYLADYYTGKPWERMQNQFEKFAEFCKSQRIELKVVIFPFLQNLDQESPFDHARALVQGFCQERDIPVVDLHGILSRHAKEKLTVSLFDTHPNPRAHQLAAEEILSVLFETE